MFTVPVTTGIAAWIFLDENIAWGQVVGTAAVIAGVALNPRAATH